MRPARRGIALLGVRHGGGGYWSLAIPKKPQGQGGADGQKNNEEGVKTGLGCTLDFPTTPQEEGSEKGFKKTPVVLIVNSLLY